MSDPRILFAYWGRRGALARMALDLAETLVATGSASALSISRENELFDAVAATGAALVPVATYGHGIGALTRPDRLVALRRDVGAAVERDGFDAVVTLMSHVWSPLVAPRIRRAGARYGVVVHDAEPHPGDRTGLATNWLLRDARAADRIIALSEHVARRLDERLGLGPERVTTLFLPEMSYGDRAAAAGPHRPMRFLFLGRIMPYKGLPLLVKAAEMLAARGRLVALGVAGEGEIAPGLRARLDRLGAEVINRWLGHDEIPAILERYDAMALSYVEASQSGVASVAIGHGMPMVATPVGGLAEQVADGRTGLLARAVTAEAFADALEALAGDEALYRRLQAGLAEAREAISMRRFVERIGEVMAG